MPVAADRLAAMPAIHARKQQKLTYDTACRQPIAAIDRPQLDGKPHALLGRSERATNNNKLDSPCTQTAKP